MTKSPSAQHRRRPWSNPTPRGVDLALATSLFLLEAAWLVLDPIFGLGLEVWAAQGNQPQVDSATLAYLDRVRVVLIVVLVVTVLAGLFRARRTAIAHLVMALLVGAVLTATQHQWDNDHASSPGCVRVGTPC